MHPIHCILAAVFEHRTYLEMTFKLSPNTAEAKFRLLLCTNLIILRIFVKAVKCFFIVYFHSAAKLQLNLNLDVI